MIPADDVLRRFYTTPPEKVLLVLVPLLIGAAIFDVRYRKIPNWLTIAGVVLGFVVNFGIGPPDGGILFALKGFAVGFGIFICLYVLRATGAGDVKLMSAVGALVGWERWVGIFLVTAVVGGIIAIILVAARGRLRRTLFNVGFILSEMKHGRPAYAAREELDVRSSTAMRLPRGAVMAIGTLLFLAIAARLTH